MVVEFDYREEKSQIFGNVNRPIAKVKIMNENKKRWVSQFLYIDSGADFTIVPYKMGAFLGFTAEKGDKVEEVQGINGVIGVILKKAIVKIGENEFSAIVGWAQIEHVPLLLGRADIFNRFNITFKEAELKTIFDYRGG